MTLTLTLTLTLTGATVSITTDREGKHVVWTRQIKKVVAEYVWNANLAPGNNNSNPNRSTDTGTNSNTNNVSL